MLIENLSIPCKNGKINFYLEPTCEHCGQLEPYDMEFFDDCTGWCRWCAESNGDIGDVDPDWIEAMERKMKIDYYKEQIIRLEEE